MGGRGSSSVRGGEISLPRISGSKRQVSWANDILRTPYQNLGNAATTHERIAKALGSNGASEREQASAYRAAQKRYADQVRDLGSGKEVSANQIIDRRTVFSRIAQNITVDEFRKRGLKSVNVSIPR